MGGRPWFEEAFGHGYLEVYPHRDLAAARAEVAGLVRQGLAGRTLDLGCGFGRHTLALREEGLDAFGLDLSAELLAHAASLDADGLLRGRLARGDVRRLPFRSATFDGVLMLFSSFGYFDDAGNAAVAAQVARLVRAGGVAVLDVMNPARIRATLVPESLTERGRYELHERRRLTEDGRRVVKDVTLRRRDADGERRWREDVRLYEPDELATLLAGAGLRVERTLGDFDGAPFTAESPRQIGWARREAAS